MTSPLQFLRKVIRVRRALIKSGKSYRPVMEMEEKMKPMESWLNHWGDSATDKGAMVLIRKYGDDLVEIIPGGDAGCGPALREQLNEFLTNT